MSTEELDPRFNGAADQIKLQDFYKHEARALELAGEAKTLAEALDQWEAERVAIGELFDENQALTISFLKYDLTMSLAEQIIGLVERDAGMFITQATRNKIEIFREQMQELEKRRAADRQNVVDSNSRKMRA